MIRNILITISIILMLCSCSGKKDEPVYEKIIFNVDTTLLGKRITIKSAGLEFYSPKGYVQMDDQMFQNLKTSLLNLEGFKHFPMLAAVSESQTGILLFIKLFPEDSTLVHLPFSYVEKVLQPKDTNVTLNKATFTKDSIDILQYLVDTDETVNFKLFFHDKDSNLYELDYIFVSKEDYKKNIRAIESSIGSLKIN